MITLHPPLRPGGLAFRSAGSGPPVVLLHGFPLDSRLWLDQLEALAGTFRVIAPDLRGYGDSPAVTGGTLTVEAHADDVATLVNDLETGPVHLAGLSMGGYVALALWERHPGILRSLALVDTRATADRPDEAAARAAAAEALVADGRRAFARAQATRLLAPGASLDARARLHTMIEATAYETIVAQLRGLAARADRTGLLTGVTVPALVMVGEHDAVTPPDEARAMARAVPGAALTEIPGSGHLTPIERPAETAEALRRFWAG